ncbi:hypothetical protein TrRE_jg13352 [Triparma retinervis]|uniref:DUF938 domain-containing protein n=1 Tax=Triparma retinervis TaxID=2557542 RepID=A0A9W7ED86_9STRA|nr:hypothetical protein TrRE_jg13352 [Triparma retinervis]
MLNIIPDDRKGKGIEIASGTGALLELITPAYPGITWQPTEYVPEERADPQEQWSKHGKIGLREVTDELRNIDYHGSEVFKNCDPAVGLDLMKPWPAAIMDNRGAYEVIVCTNTLHITPIECSTNLFRGAGEVLSPGGGVLVLYGPFKVGGKFIGEDGGEGNERFDEKLRNTNAGWGLRDVGDLEKIAGEEGLELRDQRNMPANNLLLPGVPEQSFHNLRNGRLRLPTAQHKLETSTV